MRGGLKICAYDEEKQELAEIISTGENPQIVRVPGYYWHGFKVIGNEPAMLVYFVNRPYENAWHILCFNNKFLGYPEQTKRRLCLLRYSIFIYCQVNMKLCLQKLYIV